MRGARAITGLASCALLALAGCYRSHEPPAPSATYTPVPPVPDLPDTFDPPSPPLPPPLTAGVGAIPPDEPPDAGLMFPPTMACSVRDFRAGVEFAPVDMVWVVDSSQSMMDEQARIAQTIGQFVSDVEARHFDVRLVMITANDIVPPPLGSDVSRYRFVSRYVDSSAPLQALLDELPRYRDFLRPNAALHFVAVTDDESEITAQAFQSQMDTQLGRPYLVHAVASPDVDGQPCRSVTPSQQCIDFGVMYPQLCGAAAVGAQYWSLAAATGGQRISVCVDDFRDVFGPLADALTHIDVPCAIDIGDGQWTDGLGVLLLRPGVGVEPVARIQSFEQCGGSLSYYYADNDHPHVLMLCDDTCTSANTQGAQLRLELACVDPD